MSCGVPLRPEHSARLVDGLGAWRVTLAYVVAPRSGPRVGTVASAARPLATLAASPLAPRPAFVLVDAGGRAVACFRDRPFIAHPDLDALLVMHGLTRRDLVRPTKARNDTP
jgi:hypothetical protein